MASTAVEICNLALLRVGVKRAISSLSDVAAEAVACTLLYAAMRDKALQAAPWAFATRRSTLAPLTSITRSNWNYAFLLPSGCIRARHTEAGSRTPPRESLIPFAIEDDATEGTLLLCDSDAPELVYTARVSETRFPPDFVDALAWLLAAELVLVLPIKPELEPMARQRYQSAIKLASAVDANQGYETPLTSTYERIR